MIENKVVTKVIDGDTINVEPFLDGSTSVRLLGIDTPETNYNGHSQGAHAEAAKAFLQQVVQVGDTVTIETDAEERDKYGRILAYVLKNGDNINARLVAEGMAAPYQIYPNLKHLQIIHEAAVDAQRQKKGIYSATNPLKDLPFEFRMRIDRRPPHKFVGNFLTRFYYAPHEFPEVPVADRVFFFQESDAQKAGYTLRPRPINLLHIVDKAYARASFPELLDAPVSALKGVSEADAKLLQQAFGIKTIADLANNKFFQWAQAIQKLAK